MGAAEKELKAFLFRNMYRHAEVVRVRVEADRIVRELFDAYYADPRAMPDGWREGLDRAEPRIKARHVSDFLAGMTDTYAIKEYVRLFDREAGFAIGQARFRAAAERRHSVQIPGKVPMNVFADFNERIKKAVESLDLKTADGGTLDLSRIAVEPPRDASHGDLATNAAMVLAKAAGQNPRALAETLADGAEG